MAKIGIAGTVKVNVASSRFRILIPKEHSRHTYVQGIGDITILSKFGVDMYDVRRMKGRTKLLFDVSDDHFDTARRDYYMRLCEFSDAITCTNEVLQARIFVNTGKTATVISDPLELPTKPPHIGTEKLLWYGNKTNLPGLLSLDLPKESELAIVTNEPGYIPWSLKNMQKALSWCDLVILPLGSTGAKHDAKSPNRMTEAINAGRFVVANEIPAYQGFGMYLGDILEGIEWIKSHQQEAMEALQKAQPLVWEKHSPKVISEQWDSLFDYILDAEGSYGKGSQTLTSLGTGQARSLM